MKPHTVHDTMANIQAQQEKDKKIDKARKKLRACQQDRDMFLVKYPDHAEARRIYEAQIKTLNAELDRLIRGGA